MDIKAEIHAATAQTRRDMGQEVHVLDLRDNGLEGSLNPLDLFMENCTDHSAMARSLAAEMIERTADELKIFWSDWAEIILAGGIAWLISDCLAEKRQLSALFDLFSNDDVDYALAILLQDKEKVKNRSALSAFTSFLQLPSENTRPSVLVRTLAADVYFDNVRFMFNGDRMVLGQAYKRRREHGRGKELPLFQRTASAKTIENEGDS